MTDFNIGPYLAAGRHGVTATTAFAAGVGGHSVFGASTDDIATGFNHIFNGLNEIAIGVGVLAPIATAAYAEMSATVKSQVAALKSAAPKELVQAVKQVDPATLVNAAAEVPSVTKIIAAPAMAS